MNLFSLFSAPPESRCESSLCPLNRLKIGATARIRQLTAAPEIATRLREMGFCEDQWVKLIVSQSCLVCQICHARLAISEQLAQSIWVEPLPSAHPS